MTQAGLCVIEMAPGSPAVLAGVKAKDVLLSINGKPMLAEGDVAEAIAPLTVGQPVTLTYLREAQTVLFW